ncbi:hypothetical protein OSTOST_05320 [Ostertagia ostertagi]
MAKMKWVFGPDREPASIKFFKNGTHGYDFIIPTIHMIMFARGPSFKENYVLPSFKNVEYMNLWTKLLGIPMVKTDGDPWFMDLALKNHTTPQPVYSDMRLFFTESATFGVPQRLQLCTGCSAEEKFEKIGWEMHRVTGENIDAAGHQLIWGKIGRAGITLTIRQQAVPFSRAVTWL